MRVAIIVPSTLPVPSVKVFLQGMDIAIVSSLWKEDAGLILDAQRYRRMGAAGRKNVEQYNTSRFFSDFVDILNQ